jgi:aminocarboxymuconate-semialdehyde decarboxylase
MLSIDCQSHVFPKEYAELLTQNKGRLQTTRDSGSPDIYNINYWDIQRFPLDLEKYSVERKLAAMDAAGIDMSVLSVNIPSPELLDPELALQGAQICNNFLAETCQKYPDRFVAIASMALSDVDSAITELDRAIDELDMRGIFLVSNINDRPLDSPEFEPFYAHVATRGVPLVLHPTVASWQGAIQSHSMIPMMGFMIDTSFGMMQLLLGGVLDRHPTLKVVHPHTGGVVPYLMGRITEQTEVKGRGRDNITQAPMDYYQNVYQDLVSPSAQAMRYAVEFARSDRLLFGSDHPWVSIEAILNPVKELDISDEARAKIMWQNACELFGIEAL